MTAARKAIPDVNPADLAKMTGAPEAECRNLAADARQAMATLGPNRVGWSGMAFTLDGVVAPPYAFVNELRLRSGR